MRHVVARKPALAGRQSQGATRGLEPRGDMKVRFSKEAEPGSHQGPGVMWRYKSLPQ
jgi:hypothetical protein